MRTFSLLLILAFIILTTITGATVHYALAQVPAPAAAPPSSAPALSNKAFSELDAKIERATTGGKWSDGSMRLIRDFYDSYKAGHRRADWGGNRTGLGKLGTSAAQSPVEYIGAFDRSRGGQAPTRRLLSVSKDADGCYFVELEGHRIPAVPWNGAILFTSGDVVHSDLPQIGEGKPHATLELFAIFRTKDGWAMVSPAHPDQSQPLVQLDASATKPARE